MINVKIKEKINLADNTKIQTALKAAETTMGDAGRVLLRPSGTEPLIRVMVEAEDEAETQIHAQSIAEVVEKVAS